MLKTLLKLRLEEILLTMFGGGSKKKNKKGAASSKSRGIIVLIIITVAMMCMTFGLFTGIAYQMFAWEDADRSLGGWPYYAFVVTVVFAMCFVGTVFNTQKQLFEADDNELLLSMPIPTHYILYSRVVSLLVLDLLITMIIGLPAGVAKILFAGVSSVQGVIFYIVGLILTMFIAMAFTCIISFLIALISSRMKRKTLISTILMIIAFGAYMVMCFSMSSVMQAIADNINEIGLVIRRILPPAWWFATAVDSGSILYFLLFAATCLIPFFLVIFIISKNYINITTTKRSLARVEYKKKPMKVRSQMGALVRKESDRFFHNSSYMLNCGGGILLLVAMIILVPIFAGKITEVFESFEVFTVPVAVAFFALCSFATVTINTTMCSLSLEGKNFAEMRAMPISMWNIYFSKVWFNLLISVPFILVAGISVSISMNFGIVTAVFAIAAAIMYQIFFTIFAMLINIKWPMFDWTNESIVIKQSTSSMVASFVGLGLVIVIAVVGMALTIFIGENLALALIFVIFTVLTLIMFLKLKKKSRIELYA